MWEFVLWALFGFLISLIAGLFFNQIPICFGCAFRVLKMIPEFFDDFGDYFDLSGCRNKFLKTVIINGIITVLIIILIILFGNSGMKWGFFIYFAFQAFSGFGRSGMTMDNVADFGKVLLTFARPWAKEDAVISVENLIYRLLMNGHIHG